MLSPRCLKPSAETVVQDIQRFGPSLCIFYGGAVWESWEIEIWGKIQGGGRREASWAE